MHHSFIFESELYITLVLKTLISLSRLSRREEIQRIKAGNPDISHREAFSAAAKNVRTLILLFQKYILNRYIHWLNSNKIQKSSKYLLLSGKKSPKFLGKSIYVHESPKFNVQQNASLISSKSNV